jgi:ABC-type uncharacterized transport system auxiliary subunit
MMTDLGFGRRSRGVCYVLAALSMGGCFRGKLPPREFYRLVPVEVPATNTTVGKPPLTGSIFVASYKTPGIYGSGSIVYRVGEAAYGEYPSREWALPLGEMLGAMTEDVVRARGLTSGTVKFDSKDPRRDDYEWRASVRQFDEVDAPTSVSASVSLTAQLVRAADDSVIWSGSASATENVRESRQMASVVSAMSVAAVRAVTQLVDEAAAALRGLAASGARSH